MQNKMKQNDWRPVDRIDDTYYLDDSVENLVETGKENKMRLSRTYRSRITGTKLTTILGSSLCEFKQAGRPMKYLTRERAARLLRIWRKRNLI